MWLGRQNGKKGGADRLPDGTTKHNFTSVITIRRLPRNQGQSKHGHKLSQANHTNQKHTLMLIMCLSGNRIDRPTYRHALRKIANMIKKTSHPGYGERLMTKNTSKRHRILIHKKTGSAETISRACKEETKTYLAS